MSRLLLAPLLLSLGFAAPALAEERAPDIRVDYRDLNLQTSEGVAQLDRRLERAIAWSCPSEGSGTELRKQLKASSCRKAKQAELTGRRAEAIAAAQQAGAPVAVAR